MMSNGLMLVAATHTNTSPAPGTGSRDGARRHGSVLNSVDGRRRAVTCLRQELSHSVCNEPSSQGRHADCRACPRLQKVERFSHPKAFAFVIGRVGRSCLEEGTLRPSYVARSGMS